MQTQPVQPLEEMETLRKELHHQQEETLRLLKHLRNLFSEETVIKAIVEAICQHEIEADVYLDKGDMAGSASEADEAGGLGNALEERHITIEPDENSEEILHILHCKKRCLSFHAAEWEWMDADGKWPWDRKEDTLFLEADTSLE